MFYCLRLSLVVVLIYVVKLIRGEIGSYCAAAFLSSSYQAAVIAGILYRESATFTQYSQWRGGDNTSETQPLAHHHTPAHMATLAERRAHSSPRMNSHQKTCNDVRSRDEASTTLASRTGSGHRTARISPRQCGQQLGSPAPYSASSSHFPHPLLHYHHTHYNVMVEPCRTHCSLTSINDCGLGCLIVMCC